MTLTSAAEIRAAVFEQLDQNDCICVFPTETAVKFWTETYVRSGSRGVLRLDRVMAWDRFRALFLPVRTEQPVNTAIRRLFSLHLLSKGEYSSTLQWFRYPDHPESTANLAGAIGRLLPLLEELETLRADRSSAYHRLPKPFLDDCARIRAAYLAFLRERGLYEPRYLRPELENFREHSGFSTKDRFCIWFPEVCRGWDEFSSMYPFPDSIETYSIDGSHIASPLAWYPNELMELRDRLEMVEQLLDGGTPTHDIMITVGDLGRWRAHLEHEARLRDIPLSIVQGRSPLHYAPGAFLESLLDLYTHDFSLQSMKSFLLDPRYPFQDRSLQIELIQRGLQFPSIMTGDKDSEDRWFFALSRSARESDRKLLEWYGKLKQLVMAVARAAESDTLRKAIYACKEFLLGPECWPCTRNEDMLAGQVWAFCLDQLQELDRSIELTGFTKTPRLFSFYLQLLDSKEYIPQGRPPGITVYQYTVSAGVCCRHHLLLGCTEEAIRANPEGLPLMPESVWTDDRESDSTVDVLDLYRMGGDFVYLSASQQAFGGSSSIAPAWFVNQGAVVEASYEQSSPDSRELGAWAASDPRLWRATHRHASWFERARMSAFVHPRLDFAEEAPTLPLIDEFRQEDGTVRISSTQLDTFSSCPMKWIAAYLFTIDRVEYEVQQIDHRVLGTCMHTIYEEFFQEIMKLSPVFRSDLDKTYTEVLRAIVDREFARFARLPQAPTPTTMRYIIERYATDMLAIIGAEAKLFDGYASVGFEAKQHNVYTELGYTLEGRIDRILQYVDEHGTKRYAVVDYKKSISDRKKDYDPEHGSVPSNQLPIYAKLIRERSGAAEDSEVTTAAYYNIGEGRYMVIWGDGEQDKRDALVEIAEKRIEAMLSNLKEGRVGVTSDSRSCIHCDYRQICRRRYSLV